MEKYIINRKVLKIMKNICKYYNKSCIIILKYMHNNN